MTPWTTGKVGEWAWLCHHGLLLEQLNEPSGNRVDYVKKYKSKHEQPVRLEWFRPVLHPERLPEAVVAAWTAYITARASAAVTALVAYVKARAAYYMAVADHWDEIVALHKEEYPNCPFDYEKRTLVFPEVKK